MASIAPERSVRESEPGSGSSDPLRRAVHVALAVYLLPVVAVVCAIGAVAIVAERVARPIRRITSRSAPAPTGVDGRTRQLATQRDPRHRKQRVGR